MVPVSKLLVLSTVCFAALAAAAQTGTTPQQFVYVNDDSAGSNKIEGFSVSPAGAATPVPGSPYKTGSEGSGGGLGYYPTREMAIRTGSNPILYVTNDNLGQITYFSINPANGTLKPSGQYYNVAVSPAVQINLAVTPNGKYLFLYTGSCDEIFACFGAYSIAANGSLHSLPGKWFPPLDVVPDFLITPDGKFLMASGIRSGVGVYAINDNGSLTPVRSSPVHTVGFAEGLDIDCAGKHLFVGDATSTGVSVEVFSVSSEGRLTAIPGSPFTSQLGSDSATVRLSPNGKLLYVGNANGATITVFSVASNGSLTEVPGSPFTDGNPLGTPAGLSLNSSGNLLFVADYLANNRPPALDILSAQPDGTLLPASGSPVMLAPDAAPISVLAYPPAGCNAN